MLVDILIRDQLWIVRLETIKWWVKLLILITFLVTLVEFIIFTVT
jgi:hypothetical protein